MAITADNQAGGLVGHLGARIDNSHATGAVSGGSCGGDGLVGRIGGSLDNPPGCPYFAATGPAVRCEGFADSG